MTSPTTLARRLLIPTGLALAVGLTLAAAHRAASAPAPDPAVPVVVELFTSEGCSSCPPADALLTALVDGSTAVLGLSEHVDYWDQLGWKDPFSAAQFSRRQSAYAAASNSIEVYTPQMVVDGGPGFVGSDAAAARDAIRRAAASPKPPIRLTWDPAGSDRLEVGVDPDPRSAGADVQLAVTEDGLVSSVARGENAGRRLTHSAVTRRLASIGRAGRDGAFQALIPVAVDSSWRRDRLHVVVFVQRADLRIVAAGTIAVR